MMGAATLVIDAALCGRLPDGSHALTAFGFAAAILMWMHPVAEGIAAATVAAISRAHGAGKSRVVNGLARNAFAYSLMAGLAFGAVGSVFAEPALLAIGTPADLVPTAIAYLRPSFAFCVFSFIFSGLSASLRAVGNTRLPLVVSVVENLVNAPISYVLMFGPLGLPAIGIAGAAYGTAAAKGIAALLLIAFVMRGRSAAVRLEPGPISFRTMGKLARFGAPITLHITIVQISLLVSVILLGRLDPLAVGANIIAGRLNALAQMVGLAASRATAALVGNALGRSNASRAFAAIRMALRWTTGSLTVLSVIGVTSTSAIVALFGVEDDSGLARLTTECVQIICIGLPLFGGQIVLAGAFMGAGSPKVPLFVTVVTTLLVQLPVSVVLAFPLGWGPTGIWVALPLTLAARMVLSWIVLQRGKWRRVGA